LVACFLLFLAGCDASKATFRHAEKWLPGGFNPQAGVLLIERVAKPKKQQKEMEKYMAEHYPYRYEFIDLKSITRHDEKYADSLTYRFLLVNAVSGLSLHQDEPMPTCQGVKVMGFDFNFYDRLTKKLYPATGKASTWGSKTFKPVINTILQNTRKEAAPGSEPLAGGIR